MTKLLYLARHGESMPADVDPHQPLSEKGRKETSHVAGYLKGLNGEIDEVIHSTKLRAKQTAEILRDTIVPDLTMIEKEGLKPMDPIEPILQEVELYDRNVMLVGHLPFMERLASMLLLGEERVGVIDFCGSCVVCLYAEHGSWSLEWIVSPKLLAIKQHA